MITTGPALFPRNGAAVLTHITHVQARPFDDPFALGVLAATHSLDALASAGGRPWTARVSLTLPVLPPDKTAADLDAALAGIDSVLAPAGCEPVLGQLAISPAPGMTLFVLALCG